MRDWDRFYIWLNPDPDIAESEYKGIRVSLISYFRKRVCPDAEGLADQTIERVVKLLPKFGENLPSHPLRYCYGVARNIHKEYVRELSRNGVDITNAHPVYNPSLNEAQDDLEKCLHNCLEKLDKKKRDLFLNYYLVGTEEKSVYHQKMADELGITLTALRLQILRIKEKLRACIADCQQQGDRN
jgi:RNA polymerase sigma factor (sigma-70 family)